MTPSEMVADQDLHLELILVEVLHHEAEHLVTG